MNTITNLSATLVMSFFLLSPNASAGKTFVLNCDIDGRQELFKLNVENTSVELFNLETSRTGELATYDRKYLLHFPETEFRYEIIVKIDRYYGTLKWEHGTSPFGIFQEGNVFRSGTCQQEVTGPLF